MGLYIVRGDLTKRNVDAIVCTANSNLYVGGALGRAMIEAGGQAIFDDAAKVGHCDIGSSVILPGHNLSAKYIIHSVGPIYSGDIYVDAPLLKSAYLSALKLAKKNNLESIEFPLISTGSFGFPKDIGCEIALNTIREFLKKNEMSVGIVINREDTFKELANLFDEYKVYDGIGYGQYVNHEFRAFERNDELDFVLNAPKCFKVSYACAIKGSLPRKKTKKAVVKEVPVDEVFKDQFEGCAKPGEATSWANSRLGKATEAANPIDWKKRDDKPFKDVFRSYILKSGLEDPDVYKAAGIDRKAFSKYFGKIDEENHIYPPIPKKMTVYAFAIVLKLNRHEAEDLLGAGGYAMYKGNTFDYVMGQIFDRKIYDLDVINGMLMEHSLPLFGY